MFEPSDRAQRYRFRAEELRTVAEGWMDPDAIITLATLAMQYEKMADALERGKPKPDGEAFRSGRTPPGLPL